ncbi:oligosaccharide flippase family protein [Lacisediminihabitans sp. FW035]
MSLNAQENPADAQLPDLSLTDKVRRGAFWAGGSSIFLRFANIALTAVVARIVAPEELGIFALTLVIYGIVVSLAELGVSSAIARSDLDPDEIAPTIATISIATSLLLASAVAVFAVPIATALGSADAAVPIRIMALCVAMIGPFAVPGAQLQREFRQDVVFKATAISFVPSSIVLIVIALLGDGAVAFAWSRVIGQIVMGTIMTLGVSKRYLPGFSAKLLRPLLRFGLPLAFANVLSNVLLNIDYVFVGRFLTLSDVGLYNLAFNISMWSTAVIGTILNGIVLPAFSHVRAKGGDVPDALRGAVRTVAFVACPIGAVTIALATPLVVTIYGHKWASAAPVLGVLAVYGVISVICLLLANVIISAGRTGILFLVQALAIVCLVPAMWAGVTLGGLIGVGVAHIVVILLATFPLYVLAIRRAIGTGPVLILRAMLWPALAAAAAGVAAWSVALLLPGDPLKLLVGGLAAVAVYVVLTAPLVQAVMPGGLARHRVVSAVMNQVGRPSAWVLARTSTK